MLNRLDRMIVLAGVTMLIGVAPALAHGGGSHGHGRSSYPRHASGASARSFGPATTRMSTGRAIHREPCSVGQDACDNRAWCTGDDDERHHDLGGGRPASCRPPGSGGGCCERVAFDKVGRWRRRVAN